MSEIAIQVHGLGKRYSLGGTRKPYRTARETLADLAAAAFRRRRGPAAADGSFWALKDVNFTVNRGEVVGIIGRNGAGKSTLLKVLSRITDPTEGGVDINGRVGSLLEVGTGFHPELTGRENVYLNGAILGMRRAEITKKFDEIVAFAETENFLDTPVKFYSSGMYTRLAFAVAAHLDPEILIVDEVLAVGDAAFQKKCLGKMKDVAGAGRTVLFVSHNMGSLRQLCTTGICLSGGRVTFAGGMSQTLEAYAALATPPDAELADARGRSVLNVRSVEARVGGVAADAVSTGEDVTIAVRLQFHGSRPAGRMTLGLALESMQTGFVMINYSHFQDVTFAPEDGTYVATLSRLPVVAGVYQVHLRIVVGNDEVFWNTRVHALTVHQGDFFRTGVRGEESLCPWNYEVGWGVEPEAARAS